jgi:hypothetical protein
MSGFPKTLAEVVLDGARADEQLGANLRVRVTLGGAAGDLVLIGRTTQIRCCLMAPVLREWSRNGRVHREAPLRV